MWDKKQSQTHKKNRIWIKKFWPSYIQKVYKSYYIFFVFLDIATYIASNSNIRDR